MKSSRIVEVSLLLLSAVAITAVFIFTRSVLVPFVLSIFAYAIISVCSHFIEQRLGLPRWASIVLILLSYFIVSFGILFFISGSINSFVESWDIYRDQLLTFVSQVESFASSRGLLLDGDQIRAGVKTLPVFSYIKGITGSAFSILGNAFLIFIFLIFFIAGEGKGSAKVGPDSVLSLINQKISRYILTKFMLSVLTGTLVGILLMLCRVDLAFMFAILTVLLNFIPNIGSIVATVLPLPIVLLQYGLGWQFFVVLTLAGFFQMIIGNILEPKLMGESMDLHPVAILLFLMFWGLVWGVPGMFMAVPITAVLKIVLSRIEATKPLAELLAGRF